ncbi:MAG: hypothetical protein LBQ06_08065, partial [Frankiaceae bacterium]|nr:hypothetical protein [Frankiaceae bacterium]
MTEQSAADQAATEQSAADQAATERRTPAMPRRTSLAGAHEAAGATMTDFAGWWMPLRYGSEIREHQAVRTVAGLVDLGHMGQIDVRGPGAGAALDYALVGELSRMRYGKAKYSMICAPDGGVLDDLVVYRLTEDRYLVIANAANRDLVTGELIARAAGFDASVALRDETEAGLIAIQGPAAAGIVAEAIGESVAGLGYYACRPAVLRAGAASAGVSDATGPDAGATQADTTDTTDTAGAANPADPSDIAGADPEAAGRAGQLPVLLARTGYTGEDGFELFCRAADAPAIWADLLRRGAGAGLIPAGLSCRDSLRLEAGMPLYGHELSAERDPYEAGLGRVVKLDKPGGFVGEAALRERSISPARVLVGLRCAGRR